MSAMMWIVTAFSVLGIGGAIAAVILVPAVAIPIIQSAVAATLRCKPCLIALAIFAALFSGALYGSHVERAKCRAGELAAKLRDAQIDAENAEKSAKDESDRATRIETNATTRQKDDADYIKHLEARAVCALDDADIGSVPNHGAGTGGKNATTRSK